MQIILHMNLACVNRARSTCISQGVLVSVNEYLHVSFKVPVQVKGDGKSVCYVHLVLRIQAHVWPCVAMLTTK